MKDETTMAAKNLLKERSGTGNLTWRKINATFPAFLHDPGAMTPNSPDFRSRKRPRLNGAAYPLRGW
jgi:hypothetical protein